MNLKHFYAALALTSVGVLSFGMKADAFSFAPVGQTNAGPGLTNYLYRFTADAVDNVAPNTTLSFAGFTGIQNISFAAPVNNVANVVTASFYFNLGSFTATTANFVTKSTIFGVTGPVNFETFVVTAQDLIPGGSDGSFGGNPIQAVPEPLNLLGAMTAAGLGAAFKRRSSKTVD